MDTNSALLMYQKLCEKGIDKISLSLINPNFVQVLNENNESEQLPPCVTPKYMKFVCALLEPRHWEQIVEERNIAELCGYPACPNRLNAEMMNAAEEEKSKRGRYHIDLKNRKVYDRSNTIEYYYCSNKCKYDCTAQKDECDTSAPYTRDCYNLLVMLFPDLREKILLLKKHMTEDVKEEPKPKTTFKKPTRARPQKTPLPVDVKTAPLAMIVKEHVNPPQPEQVIPPTLKPHSLEGYTPMAPTEYTQRIQKNKEKQTIKQEDVNTSEDEGYSSDQHPGLSLFLDSDTESDDGNEVKNEMSMFVLLWTLLSRWVTGKTIVHMNPSKMREPIQQEEEPQQVPDHDPNDELDEATMRIYQDLYAKEDIDITQDLTTMKLVGKKKYVKEERMENVADEELARILAHYSMEDDTANNEVNIQRLNLVLDNLAKNITPVCSQISLINASGISSALDDLVRTFTFQESLPSIEPVHYRILLLLMLRSDPELLAMDGGYHKKPICDNTIAIERIDKKLLQFGLKLVQIPLLHDILIKDHVHKQFLEQGVASCKRLCDEFIRPSLGPNGAFKMIQVPGGRLTISASIQKILHAIQKQQEEQDRLNLHPVARLLMKAAENHSNKYVGDSCGLYIIFTTTLLELLVKSNGNDFRVQQINRSLSQFLHTILPNKIVPHLFENSIRIKTESQFKLEFMCFVHSFLTTNTNRTISKTLTELFLQLVFERGSSEKIGFELLKRNIALISRRFETKIVSIAGGPLQSSQFVRGVLIENKRASQHMPVGLENANILLCKFSTTDLDDENESDITVKINQTIETMKQLTEMKTKQALLFVKSLLDANVGALILQNSRFDNELVKILTKYKIMLIQNVDKKEIEQIEEEFCGQVLSLNILTASMNNEISIIHFDAPKTIEQKYIVKVKSIKEIAFSPTRCLIHIIHPSSTFCTLLLRGPVQDIVDEYALLIKRLVLCIDHNIQQVSLLNRDGLYLVSGAGATEASVASYIRECITSTESIDPCMTRILLAVADSLDACGLQLIHNGSLLSTNRNMLQIYQRMSQNVPHHGFVSVVHAPIPLQVNALDGMNCIGNSTQSGIFETLSSKYQLLMHGIETVKQLLRIHGMVAVKKAQ